MTKHIPPKRALQFLRWFCHEDYIEEIEGDITELFEKQVGSAPQKARWKFVWSVVKYFRPEFMKAFRETNRLNEYAMYKNYFIIGWRNLVREKGYSFINIGGLALGITVTLLIGLWVRDEFSFNKQQDNYNRVAAVLQNNTVDGKVDTWSSQSYQLGQELRNQYGSNFKYVAMSTFASSYILDNQDKAFSIVGCFMEPDGPELLSLKMIHGTRAGLKDPSSVMLSASVAHTFFGDDNVVGQSLKLDNSVDLKITGIYQDIPSQSDFKGELAFIAPLEIIVNKGGRSFGWGNNWLQVFVELEENVDFNQASLAIKDAKMRNVSESDKRFKPELFLHPLSKWHLHSDFKDGVNTGGRIEMVWMFGSIGGFVLLLACINFMNLSTARAQKRSKEIGVRKVIGSSRGQLSRQFLVESFVVVLMAFAFALLLMQLLLPWFNLISNKQIQMPWTSMLFWLTCSGALILVAFISGSYPALYLSSFNLVKALKGTFKTGRNATWSRKTLVVAQFTISGILITGTLVVYQQIQFVRNRPLGYDLRGLVTLPIKTKEVKTSYSAFRNELLSSGKFAEVSTSETTATNLWWSDWGFEWRGKNPNVQDNIYRGAVSYEFGKTIGWKIKQGRDFLRAFASDSTAMILNEAAVKYMGFEDPIGETIRAYGKTYTVIGVVEDMMTQSLYESNKQTVFVIDPFDNAQFINIRINPDIRAFSALDELNRLFIKYNPNTPFEYTFADDEFADKFSFEARVGRLVGIFSVIAILISGLGLLGLASFVVEQRTKEISIRKVLGASITGIWGMLSKDFVGLVVLSGVISMPIGYYFMSEWLEQYDYRTGISVWTLLLATAVILLVTVVTVSFQTIKAAIVNPVTTLKSE